MIKDFSIILASSIILFFYYSVIKDINIIIYMNILLGIFIYKSERNKQQYNINLIEYYKTEIEKKNNIITDFAIKNRKRLSTI